MVFSEDYNTIISGICVWIDINGKVSNYSRYGVDLFYERYYANDHENIKVELTCH